jgi:hypothetical protein
MKYLFQFKKYAKVFTTWTKLFKVLSSTFDYFMEQLEIAFPDDSNINKTNDRVLND